MAPSEDQDQDKETEQNPITPKPENPFIQFRQFADTQISSLLQGIIGLPSAFSRRPTEEGRWAEIDDDLRRRDDMQARRKELRESEARRFDTQPDDDRFTATSTPTEQRPGWETQPTESGNELNKAVTRDVPLYSPVTKSLFSQSRERDEDGVDWNESSNLSIDEASSRLRNNPQPLKFDSDPMKMTQNIVHSALGTLNQFRSEYSLLPYLMLSPYSPLRISQSQTEIHSKDEFPYCEAFEDLLRTTQDMSPSHLPRMPLHQPLVGHPLGNMMWLGQLYMMGLLQPKDEIQYPFKILLRPTLYDEKVTGAQIESPGTPKTELDMYDHFLKWASSPSPITDAMKSGEAFLASLENGFVSREHNKEDTPLGSPFSIMKEILDVAREFRDLSDVQDDPPKPIAESQSLSGSRSTKPIEDRDRVLSTSTTSERTVHEDGTVETSITVWKRYSSGRETSTTTHHCEDPAVDDDSGSKIGQQEKQEIANNEKKNGKSGWFWN